MRRTEIHVAMSAVWAAKGSGWQLLDVRDEMARLRQARGAGPADGPNEADQAGAEEKKTEEPEQQTPPDKDAVVVSEPIFVRI